MRTPYCFFIMPALFMSGCASTRIVEPNAPTAVFEKIKHDTRKRDAKMTLTSGETLNARNIQFTQDSTVWMNAQTGKRQTVSTTEVRKIVIKKSRALRGFRIGALVGVPVGVLIAGSLNSESSSDSCRSPNPLTCIGAGIGEGFAETFSAVEKIIAVTGAAAVGGLAGLVIGVGVGSKETYQFTQSKEQSSKGQN